MRNNPVTTPTIPRSASRLVLLALLCCAPAGAQELAARAATGQRRAFAEFEEVERLLRRGQILQADDAARRLLEQVRSGQLPPAYAWRCQALTMDVGREAGRFDEAIRAGYRALDLLNQHAPRNLLARERRDLSRRIAEVELQRLFPDTRIGARLLPLPVLSEANADASLARAVRLLEFALEPPSDGAAANTVRRLETRAMLARACQARGDRGRADALWSSVGDAATRLRSITAHDPPLAEQYAPLARLTAQAAFGRGDNQAGVAALLEVLDHPTALAGPLERAAWLSELAEVQRELKAYADERARLEEALAALDAHSIEDAPPDEADRHRGLLTDLRYRLALRFTADGQVEASERKAAWQSAADACETRLAELDDEAEDAPRVRLRCLARLQNCYVELARPAEAQQAGQELVELLNRHVPPKNDLRHAHARASLGQAYLDGGDLPAAGQSLDEAIKLYCPMRRRAADAYALAVLGRATVHASMFEFHEARELLRAEESDFAATLPPDSLTLAQFYSTLAGLLALEGRYADALPRFDRALTVLIAARAADPRRANEIGAAIATADLNAAALERAQGRHNEALERCDRSLPIMIGARSDHHPDLLPHYLLQLELHLIAAQRVPVPDDENQSLALADVAASKARDLVRESHLTEEPVGARLAAQLGALAYRKHKIEASEDKRAELLREASAQWEVALRLARQHNLVVVEVQALNQLAALEAESRDEAALRAAADKLDKALARLGEQSVFPNLRYATLVNRAGVLLALSRELAPPDVEDARVDERAQAEVRSARDGAKTHLREAVRIVEAPRAGRIGDAEERAGFFSHYAAAYDLLIDLLVEEFEDVKESNPAAARDLLMETLFVAESGRNRSLLDQVHAAGLRAETLDESDPDRARRRRETESQLATIHSALKALNDGFDPSGLLPADSDYLNTYRDDLQAQHGRLDEALEHLDDEQARHLNETSAGAVVFELDERKWRSDLKRLETDDVLFLVYHVGEQSSHVFLLGRDVAMHADLDVARPSKSEPTVLNPGPLNAGEIDRIVERITNVLRSKEQSQTLVEQLEAETDEPRPSTVAIAADGAATDRATRSPADYEVAADDFDQVTVEVRMQKLSEAILPDSIVRAICDVSNRAGSRPTLLIVPDGALHRLPFEALLVDDDNGAGERKAFLADLEVDTAYAPSLSVLARLTDASDKAPREVKHDLVTLGIRDHAAFGFELLEQAENESNAVAKTIGGRFKPLIGSEATEGALRESLREGSCRFLHLATHAHVNVENRNERATNADEAGPDQGQRSGAERVGGFIVLAPSQTAHDPRAANPTDDGKLHMHEIPPLDLSGCELALLSACQTNLGALVPLETDASFARAFFAAGVRRVVASQWHVDDDATYQLVNEFVTRLFDQTDGQRSYAAALAQARRALREGTTSKKPDSDENTPNEATSDKTAPYRSPYYWAPFVLLGPAE